MNCSMTFSQKLFAVAVFMSSLTFGTPVLAAEQRTGKSFDHVQTGFPLLGAHAQTDCQTCHLQGVFKGTPRECVGCHTQGSRIASTFKTANHPLTAMPCSQCHSSQVSWAGARFDHTGVAPGSCASCHNGVTATGKPPRHVVTNASCDQCHRTTAWVPAGFDHTGVAPGACETCHVVGGPGTPRPGAPHPATGSCDQCHTTGGNWTPKSADHSTFIAGQCNTCHGVTATGKPNNHIPSTFSCDACHNRFPARFTSTTFTRNTHDVAHEVNPNQCATCHNGSYTVWGANPKNNRHIPTTVDCDACHYAPALAFKPHEFSHSVAQGVTTGQCKTCHTGGENGTYNGAKGPKNDNDHKQADHALCDNCHTTNNWDTGGGNLLPARSKKFVPTHKRFRTWPQLTGSSSD